MSNDDVNSLGLKVQSELYLGGSSETSRDCRNLGDTNPTLDGSHCDARSNCNGHVSDEDQDQWTQVRRSSSVRQLQKKRSQLPYQSDAALQNNFNGRGYRRGSFDRGRGSGFYRPTNTFPRGRGFHVNINQSRQNDVIDHSRATDFPETENSQSSPPISNDLPNGQDSNFSRGSNRLSYRPLRNRGSFNNNLEPETFNHRLSSPPAPLNGSAPSANPRYPTHYPQDDFRRTNHRRPFRGPGMSNRYPAPYGRPNHNPGRNRPMARSYTDTRRYSQASDAASDVTSSTNTVSEPVIDSTSTLPTKRATWADAVAAHTDEVPDVPAYPMSDYLIDKWKVFSSQD